ncbi:MAG: glycosyltransferase [Gemmatimonadales bacterium]
MGGGIARWIGALAACHPPESLVVSTGAFAGSEAFDAGCVSRVDRIGVPASRLRTIGGLLAWSRRALQLAAPPTVRFAWCGNVRPAIYPAFAAHHRRGLPFGVIVHGGDLLTLRERMRAGRWKRHLFRRMLAATSVFVANSSWTARACGDLLAELGIDGDVRVVPPGTDPVRFHPDRVAGDRFRVSRGLPAGRWLVTVARLVHHKGIDTAIAALASIAEARPDLQYAVIGRGDDLTRLADLATRLGIRERVHFVTDVDDKELPSAYGMGDIYLGLSREDGIEVEGFGIALLEAAATGLPVIAGRSGGTSDAVADGVTGHLIDPLSADDAARVIASLLDDPDHAARLGRAGRERVIAEFTWDAVVTRLQSLGEEFGRR